MGAMRLRVRSPSGVHTVKADGEWPLRKLQEVVQELTGVAVQSQRLLTGHPPRALVAADGGCPAPDARVSTLLSSGDSLVVEVGAPTAAAGAPTAAAAAPTPVHDVDAAVAAAPPPPRSPAPAPNVPPVSGGGRGGGGGEPASIADGGTVVRRVVPDDNACLFTAVAYVATGGQQSATELRLVTASAVSAQPDTYTAAVLGRPPLAYVDWIVRAATWGGAIELAVLAAHFRKELASADIQSGRLDVFGEGAGYATRCYLLYDGIHYDAVALALGGGSGADDRSLDVTEFPADDGVAAAKVLALAAAARARHQYTDVASFALICRDCNEVLAGEAAAQAHAARTAHTNFEEITG